MQEGRQRGEGDTGKASDADSDKNACYGTINLIWRGTYWFREELFDLVCTNEKRVAENLINPIVQTCLENCQ